MKWFIGLIVFIIIIGIGFFVFNGHQEKIIYKTEKVIKGNISEYITASGTINPIKLTVIGSQVSGPIMDIYVDYNTIVKQGQLLALIDPSLYQAKVNEAQANLNAAKANYEKLKAIIKNNKRIMDRNKELFETDLIAKIEFENAETNYLTTQAEIEAALATINQAKAQLYNASTSLRYTNIISPTSGIVISKNVEIGQTVTASFQTPTLFSVAEDLTKMQIDSNISEADISKIKKGQSVDFTVDSYPGETFKGTVVQIRNSPETIQNVVTYYVIIQVDNSQLKLKPGMTANISILVQKKNDVLLIPNESLRYTPYDKENIKKFDSKGVWILKDGEPKRIELKTGLSNEKNTEIVSKGLKEGDNIIIAKETNDDKKGKKKSFFGH